MNFNTFVLFMTLSMTSLAAEIDIVKADIGESLLDKRAAFKEEVLKRALEATRNDYGDYQLKTRKQFMNAKRAFSELTVGDAINAYFAITNPRWEELSYPIKIPVRCGVSSYRLLLVDKRRLGEFEGITNIDQLKKMKVGLSDGWTTYSIMRDQGFGIVKVGSYDSMFSMLLAGRFDYLVRGVNEVFEEVEAREDKLQNLTIEPNLALHIPSATYLFVSKNSHRVAQRLQTGLQKMQEDGTLDTICEKYFVPQIRKANLENRTIIDIPPTFPVQYYDFLDKTVKTSKVN